MGFSVFVYRGLVFCPNSRSVLQCSRTVHSSLAVVDEELRKGNERAALALVKDLQGKPGGLRCFGTARQIPQRLYSLDELKLNGIVTTSLLSPVDSTLGSIERNLQLSALLGGLAAWNVFELSTQQIFFLSLGLLFLWTLDAVSFNGGISGLVLDTIGHTFSQKYHNRVIQHEAGHFFIAYLLGILPKGYALTSLEALKKEGSLNIQAGTAFVDFEFTEEVNAGKVSATMLNRFSCIALAGVATEYLLFGCAEGGLDDINKAAEKKVKMIMNNMCLVIDEVTASSLAKTEEWHFYLGQLETNKHNELDILLRSLGFTQRKTDSQVRWAVLNTVLILRRHEVAREKLAEAMSEGKSVGDCIDIIEKTIDIGDI